MKLYISTHSLTKRLTDYRRNGLMACAFQLTASRRGWLEEATKILQMIAFQFTASRRGWQRNYRVWVWSGHFNSQPHEEADEVEEWVISKIDYFNSQPHEEADRIDYSGNLQFVISTHSLTKRLTAIVPANLRTAKDFNSQPHEEADNYLQGNPRGYNISTHSLTKRLTDYLQRDH